MTVDFVKNTQWTCKLWCWKLH